MDARTSRAGAVARDRDAVALSDAMMAGDAAAIESFYRSHFDRLYAEARRATRRDEAFCLDVVHDAVLRIVRAIRPVRSEAQLLAWLKLVVRTAALDRLRADRRRSTRERFAAGNEVIVEDAAERDEQAEWLRNEIAALDPEIVRLIELRFVQRWTLSKIAAWAGISIGALDGRLRRALDRLRDAALEVDDA